MTRSAVPGTRGGSDSIERKLGIRLRRTAGRERRRLREPVTLAAVTAVDARIVDAVRAQLRRRDGGRVGFKAAFGIDAVRELIGDTPVPGHLTTATQLAAGATFDPRGAGALHADCEVAVTVGREELGVALELVDLARQAGDMEAIVTGNVLHLAFVLGPAIARPPGEARLIVNGVVRARAPARADHRATVEALARILEAAGEQLRPGDRIITGSVVQVPVEPGDHVVAEIDGLGRAEARIAAASPPA
jgi:2-keto-4-pentenoate hydratase